MISKKDEGKTSILALKNIVLWIRALSCLFWKTTKSTNLSGAGMRVIQ